MHGSAGRRHIRRESLVIFDVAVGQLHRLLALKLGEEIRRHLAQRVDEHVQATAVRHAEHDLLHAGCAGFLDQQIEHRNQRIAALTRKTFLPDIFGMQITLERFGRGQPFEDVAALFGRVVRP